MRRSMAAKIVAAGFDHGRIEHTAFAPQPLQRIMQRAVADLMPAYHERIPGNEIELREFGQSAHQTNRARELLFERTATPSATVAATPPRTPINHKPIRRCDMAGRSSEGGRGESPTERLGRLLRPRIISRAHGGRISRVGTQHTLDANRPEPIIVPCVAPARQAVRGTDIPVCQRYASRRSALRMGIQKPGRIDTNGRFRTRTKLFGFRP